MFKHLSHPIRTLCGIIAAGCVLCLSGGSQAAPSEDPCVLLGDSSGDGVLNVQDVVALVSSVLNGAPAGLASDADGDDILSVLDVVLVITWILNGETQASDPDKVWDPNVGECMVEVVECPDDTGPSCDGDWALSGTTWYYDEGSGECWPSPGAPPQDCAASGETCQDGMCVPPECPADSPPSCDGDWALSGTYWYYDPLNGMCWPSSGAPPQDCGAFGETCEDGMCVAKDLCGPDSCPSSPPFCEGNWAHSGTYYACVPTTGECLPSPGAPPQNCGEWGQVCVDGSCVSGATECDADSDCASGYFCDFPYDDCGVWGYPGTCTPGAQICVAGGVGACGCDGTYMTNTCELQAMGTDAMKYGGCSDPWPGNTFSCGTTTCDTASEICEISINDALFPGAPLFYNNCWMLPPGCTQGDCSCMSTPGFPWDPVCYDGTGHTIVVYPGG